MTVKQKIVNLSRLIFCLAIVVFNCSKSKAQSEYMLKAAFLEKFTRYIEWSQASNMDDPSKPCYISVIGKNKFNGELETMYGGKLRIRNKKVKINYINRIDEIENTNILYICESDKSKVAKILDYTKNKPILTVSEYDGFANLGVHINFYITDKGTVHFEINEPKLKESGLRMDMLILQIAKVIK